MICVRFKAKMNSTDNQLKDHSMWLLLVIIIGYWWSSLESYIVSAVQTQCMLLAAVRCLINTRCVPNRFITIIYNKCWQLKKADKNYCTQQSISIVIRNEWEKVYCWTTTTFFESRMIVFLLFFVKIKPIAWYDVVERRPKCEPSKNEQLKLKIYNEIDCIAPAYVLIYKHTSNMKLQS